MIASTASPEEELLMLPEIFFSRQRNSFSQKEFRTDGPWVGKRHWNFCHCGLVECQGNPGKFSSLWF